MSMMLGFLVLAAILLGVPLWVVSVYNRLVSFRNLAESAWAQTDVQLRRRYDLIPNLVETVKGYATHERETFEKAIQARNAAMSATNPQARAQAEDALSSAVKSVFAVAEAYPDLKASQNFMSLQQALAGTEGFIAECRSSYNDSVLTFNNALQAFPAKVIAGLLKFQPREFFGVPQETERQAPKVQL